MATKPRVAVTRRIPQPGLDLLAEHADVALWEDDLPPSPDEFDSLIDNVDGAVTLVTDAINGELLDRHPSLRVVSNFAVGYDNVDVPACTEHGVAVCNTPGVLTETTAELAFALLISAARRIPEGVDYVREGHWKTWGPTLLMGQRVIGATLGIVGFGRIGQSMARMASGFGMRVLVNNRTKDPRIQRELNVEWVDYYDLLAESDFVSLHVALNDETHHLVGARELACMKPTAVLINAARGPIVDTDALTDALEKGTIFAAGLDVTEPEPLPADHPLVRMPNCIVVPHIGSATVETRNRMATLAAQNLLDVLDGKRPKHIVNPDVLSG